MQGVQSWGAERSARRSGLGSRVPLPLVSAAAAALYAALALSTRELSRELAPGSMERVQEYAQASGTASRDSTSFQKIRRLANGYQVHLGFRNFNQDELEIDVTIPKKAVEDAAAEFGFREKDFQELDSWYRKAQEGAIARTKLLFTTGTVTVATQAELNRELARIRERNSTIQAALDVTLADLAKEYRERRLKLYQSAGFRYKDAKTVEVDMPNLVRRNAPRLAPVSIAFSEIVQERDYGMEELVGAVTAMAQTSLRYEVPATREGDRTVGGVMPPPKSLVLGQGDCDTKTGLMGAILLNWPNLKIVGLAIPGHYLLAVHRIPARGEFFVEHEGLPFVMIEPAGPAWIPPGKVGDQTVAYLKSGKLFAIQPF